MNQMIEYLYKRFGTPTHVDIDVINIDEHSIDCDKIKLLLTYWPRTVYEEIIRFDQIPELLRYYKVSQNISQQILKKVERLQLDCRNHNFCKGNNVVDENTNPITHKYEIVRHF